MKLHKRSCWRWVAFVSSMVVCGGASGCDDAEEEVAFEDRELPSLAPDESDRACEQAQERSVLCAGMRVEELGPAACANAVATLPSSCSATVGDLWSCQQSDPCAWATANECEPIRKCGLVGEAVVDARDYLVMLKRASAAGACESEPRPYPQPGPDIYVINLEDAGCGVLGHALTVASGFGDSENHYDKIEVFDGRPSSVTDICFTGSWSRDRIYSLGCVGGFLIVEFRSEGERVSLAEGMTVHVGTRGGQCGLAVDPIDVFLCTDAAAVRQSGDVSSCNVLLGTGAGEVRVPVVFDGAAPGAGGGGAQCAVPPDMPMDDDDEPPECAYPAQPAGACTNQTDCTVIEGEWRTGQPSNDHIRAAAACTRCCRGTASSVPCDGGNPTCAEDCIALETAQQHAPMGMSASCAGCYVDFIECVFANCVAECLEVERDTGSCGPCTDENCEPAYRSCAGNVAEVLCMPDLTVCL